MTDIGLNGYLQLYVVDHIVNAARYINFKGGNIQHKESIKTCNILCGAEYTRMDQLKFVEDSGCKNLKWFCLFKQIILLQRLPYTNFTSSILK